MGPIRDLPRAPGSLSERYGNPAASVAVPPGNSLSGHLHRDADLTRVLRGVLRENRLRLNRLRKVLR